ncbi:MAG: FadR family transcriptional regulator [Phenylobacterium sp.]|nr:FadR family transcriptional regulator [Phenylobacterium sp.]
MAVRNASRPPAAAGPPAQDLKAPSPIRVPKTAEIVADAIRRMITGGELKEGDTLQPEAQIIADFAVSRPTIREAFRILESEKLISISRGARGGARVHAPKAEQVARYAGFVLQSRQATYADVYKARTILEPPVARDVAQHGGKAAVDALRAVVAEARAIQGSRHFGRVIAGFHRTLVEFSGNQTLILVSTMLEGIVARYQAEVSGGSGDTVSKRRNDLAGLKSQDKLIAMIEAGDGDAAEAHWRLHMETSTRIWLAAGAGQAIVDWGD